MRPRRRVIPAPLPRHASGIAPLRSARVFITSFCKPRPNGSIHHSARANKLFSSECGPPVSALARVLKCAILAREEPLHAVEYQRVVGGSQRRRAAPLTGPSARPDG